RSGSSASSSVLQQVASGPSGLRQVSRPLAQASVSCLGAPGAGLLTRHVALATAASVPSASHMRASRNAIRCPLRKKRDSQLAPGGRRGERYWTFISRVVPGTPSDRFRRWPIATSRTSAATPPCRVPCGLNMKSRIGKSMRQVSSVYVKERPNRRDRKNVSKSGRCVLSAVSKASRAATSSMLPTLHAKSPKVPQLELFQKLEQYASIRLGNLTTGHRRVNDRGVQQQKETAKIALKRDTEVRT